MFVLSAPIPILSVELINFLNAGAPALNILHILVSDQGGRFYKFGTYGLKHFLIEVVFVEK